MRINVGKLFNGDVSDQVIESFKANKKRPGIIIQYENIRFANSAKKYQSILEINGTEYGVTVFDTAIHTMRNYCLTKQCYLITDCHHGYLSNTDSDAYIPHLRMKGSLFIEFESPIVFHGYSYQRSIHGFFASVENGKVYLSPIVIIDDEFYILNLIAIVGADGRAKYQVPLEGTHGYLIRYNKLGQLIATVAMRALSLVCKAKGINSASGNYQLSDDDCLIDNSSELPKKKERVLIVGKSDLGLPVLEKCSGHKKSLHVCRSFVRRKIADDGSIKFINVKSHYRGYRDHPSK